MMQTKTGQPSIAARTCFIALLGLILIYLWHRNYNLLDDFFDYSILTSACGQLHEGLKPYRDFSTPLQSLTIYLCYICELVFGRRYIALGYGNLFCGLMFYVISIYLLKDRVPALLGILIAGALCAATFFQHGILWYNSVAMMLLTLIVWWAAILYRSPRLRRRDVATLCGLLFLSSMCKMNFHLLGLFFACVMLLLRFYHIDGYERGKCVWILPALIISGTVVGPIAEIVVNGASPHVYLYDVFGTSPSRMKHFFNFLDPNLYLGDVANAYPDNWSSGVYLKAMLIFAGCAYLAHRWTAETGQERSTTRAAMALRWFAPILLAGVLLGSMLLTLTNSETQMLTASFVLAGLIAVYLMFGPGMSVVQSMGFKFSIFLLSAYFFITGSASAFMHSRVRAGDSSWCEAMLQAMYKQKNLSALKNAVPIYDAAEISPSFASGYFQGVRFTELARDRMEIVVAFVEKNNLSDSRIYWGPGLQILNRVYGDRPVGRLPLWYHFRVSVSDKDSRRIIEELEKDNYEWILATGWIREMPAEVREYIASHYEQVRNDSVEIYHQKH